MSLLDDYLARLGTLAHLLPGLFGPQRPPPDEFTPPPPGPFADFAPGIGPLPNAPGGYFDYTPPLAPLPGGRQQTPRPVPPIGARDVQAWARYAQELRAWEAANTQ